VGIFDLKECCEASAPTVCYIVNWCCEERKMLGIVIATFNRLDNLKLVLASLRNQTEQGFSVIVADDGSTDGTEQFVESLMKTPYWKHRVKWVSCGTNLGFRAGRARNIGVANLDENRTLICFVDSDIILHHKALEYYRLAHSRHPKAVIMGLIYWLPLDTAMGLSHYIEDQTTEELLNRIPEGPPKRVHGTFVGGELRDQIETGLFSDDLNFVSKLRPELAITACIGYPMSLFKQIGGFDENITGYGYEDIDLGLSAQKAKASSLLYSKIKAFHIWHPKLNPEEVLLTNQVNLRYILKKHGPNRTLERELR
jgi:GT2 family glycosyltransferase